MKLSDCRGKVVVLVFWSAGYTEAPDHRKLVERMAGKPFAVEHRTSIAECAQGSILDSESFRGWELDVER